MPEQTVDITIVCDNYEHTAGLETAWGFACVVKTPDKTILFDTSGDGDILLRNLAKLEIAPADIDVVVLSHDHWDHTGGLSAFLSRNAQVTVYVLRAFSQATKAIAGDSGTAVVEVTDPVEICGGVWSTGVVRGALPEQGLVIETAPGLVVITGCAHPGIAAMVRSAVELRLGKAHLALGGFHMGEMSSQQIGVSISQLRELGLERAAPCHCSGDQARRVFAGEFGDAYIALGVGSKLKFTRESVSKTTSC